MAQRTTILKIPPEDEQKIRQIAWSLFNELAGDLLALLAAEGKYKIRRAEAIELVMDADRLSTEIQRKAPELHSIHERLRIPRRPEGAEENRSQGLSIRVICLTS